MPNQPNLQTAGALPKLSRYVACALLALPLAVSAAVYVAKGSGSFYDYPITLKDKPSDTDYVCASIRAPGPYITPGRPCDFVLWPDIPASMSIATCDTSSGTCKNQNGGIETYVVKTSISGSTPTPPVIVPPASGDGTATLNWTAPTLGTDKNPIAPITGYNLYYGTNPASLAKVSLPAMPLSYTLTNLASGTYYFAMTTCVSDCSKGNESDRTNLASKIVTVSSVPPVTPPVVPPSVPSPTVTATGGSWAAKKGSTNLKADLSSHDDCLAYLKTQPAGKYSCAFSGEVVTVGK